jgi:hypothetical protein
MVDEDGSSMTHRRDPQAFKVVLNSSQVSVDSFAAGSQIPKMSSMYLLKYRRLAENLGRMTAFSCCPSLYVPARVEQTAAAALRPVLRRR